MALCEEASERCSTLFTSNFCSFKHEVLLMIFFLFGGIRFDKVDGTVERFRHFAVR